MCLDILTNTNVINCVIAPLEGLEAPKLFGVEYSVIGEIFITTIILKWVLKRARGF
jgi:hypothetical protein